MKRAALVLSAAVAMALMVSGAALAADAARFEAESMKEASSQISPVNDTNASGGQALRFTGRGEYATKSTYNFTADATRIEVRARATQVGGKWPQIRVFVDGTILGTHDVISPVIDSSRYATYTAAVNIPRGNHAIFVKGLPGSTSLRTGEVSSTRSVWIDSIAFTYVPDTTPPETTIDSGPEQGSTAQSGDATLAFSSEPGATFECRLDAEPWAACASPNSYTSLADGSHAFEVRARDSAGNVDPSPATRTWTVASCDSTVSAGESIDAAAEALADGQALCIRGGVYDQDVVLDNGGSEGAPITVMAYPGESVELRGIFRAMSTASYLVVEGFKIDGSYGDTVTGSPWDPNDVHTMTAVRVDAPHTTWRGLDVSNRSTTDGVSQSGQTFLVPEGTTTGTVIEGSKIHDWGEPGSGNNHVHGVYIGSDEFLIRDNVFYGNEGGDRAIQMYEDADNGVIEGNIIAYSNDVGVHFSGKGQLVSGNNTATGNVVTHTVEDRNVDAYEGQLCGQPGAPPDYCAPGVVTTFPQTVEERNEFVDNCVYQGGVDAQLGGIEATAPGDVDYFHAANNIVADPLYKDVAADDYRIKAGTACAARYTGPASNTWTP